MTQRFFPDGMVTAAAFDAAETAARVEIEAIAGDFGAESLAETPTRRREPRPRSRRSSSKTDFPAAGSRPTGLAA